MDVDVVHVGVVGGLDLQGGVIDGEGPPQPVPVVGLDLDEPDPAEVLLPHAAEPLGEKIGAVVVPPQRDQHGDGPGPDRAVVAGMAIEDTVKQVDADGRILATLDRSGLWRAQTPQAFPRQALERAHAQAAARGASATDDAALVEASGLTVVVVEGSPENFKITGPLDRVLAEAVLRSRGG